MFTPTETRAETKFTIDAALSHIDVSVDATFPRVSDAQLMRWVQNASDAVVAYYGRYSVPYVFLQIRPFDGKGVRGGRTFSMRGGLIRIAVGNETTEDDLARDWMLTHEMVHLTFPSVPDEHHWIEEGIATYVEPIARIQAGQFDASRMWFELVRDMPKGLPQSGDQGLDHTHTWGRTYWGGALFYLLADIEIHQRTHNQKGLDDALRAVMNAGGVITEDWDLHRALAGGDKAVGVPVLEELYAKMKDKAVSVDL